MRCAIPSPRITEQSGKEQLGTEGQDLMHWFPKQSLCTLRFPVHPPSSLPQVTPKCRTDEGLRVIPSGKSVRWGEDLQPFWKWKKECSSDQDPARTVSGDLDFCKTILDVKLALTI